METVAYSRFQDRSFYGAIGDVTLDYLHSKKLPHLSLITFVGLLIEAKMASSGMRTRSSADVGGRAKSAATPSQGRHPACH